MWAKNCLYANTPIPLLFGILVSLISSLPLVSVLLGIHYWSMMDTQWIYGKARCLHLFNSMYSYDVNRKWVQRQRKLRLKFVFATGWTFYVLQPIVDVVCRRPQHSLGWFRCPLLLDLCCARQCASVWVLLRFNHVRCELVASVWSFLCVVMIVIV